MCLCSLEFILETISKKWTLVVINEIAREKKLRYSDLHTRLRKISPTTLSIVLKKLERIDVVKRKVYNEIPPKVEYSITRKGKEFLELLMPLHDWSKNYDILHCKCAEKHDLDEFENSLIKDTKRLIEASMCTCACMAIMTANYIFTVGIF